MKKYYILLPFAFLFAGFLAIYAVKGSYSRYLADDYCYGYRVNQNGLLNNQVNSYFMLTEYASNRFAATFFQNVAEKLGGAYFVRYLPGSVILIWLTALFYFLLQVKPTFATRESLPIALSVALTILFFTLYLAPNLYETLFWLAGMQAYVMPIVLFTILAGRLITFSKKSTLTPYNTLEIVLLAFIGAGFSETVSLWQITILGLVFAVTLLYKNKTNTKKSISTISIALAAMLAAFTILLLCPTNSVRSSAFSHPDFTTLISKSLFHAIEFIRLSLVGKSAPFLALFLLGALISPLMNSSKQQSMHTYLYTLLVINSINFMLIIVIMAPSMYVMSTYPGGRTLFPAHFTLIVTIFLNGWLLSTLVFQIVPINSKQSYALLFTLGTVVFLYSATRIAPHVYNDLSKYQARAQAWDERHQDILKRQEAGEQEITIPAFDSVYKIMAIKDKTNAWVNRCAANYYNIKSLYATQGYNGVSTYPIGK